MIHEAVITVAPDHPAFAGHFPGHPVLPGVVLLGWAAQSLADALGRAVPPCSIASAKFLRPVEPGSTLFIRHSLQPSGMWRFDVVKDGDAMATGTLRLPVP